MYHDMGYPSHSYANYLGQFESNAYGEPVHYMHHLSAAVPASASTAVAAQAPPPPSYTSDSMHHQHTAMMQSHENRTWYQPPITPQSDHRYSLKKRKKKHMKHHEQSSLTISQKYTYPIRQNSFETVQVVYSIKIIENYKHHIIILRL